jgi:hypothetical protein
MAMATTVPVEIDSELLNLLRERHPGKTDRELIEQLAIDDLGKALFDDSRRMDADPEEVLLEEAVRAVHEVRAEME